MVINNDHQWLMLHVPHLCIYILGISPYRSIGYTRYILSHVEIVSYTHYVLSHEEIVSYTHYVLSREEIVSYTHLCVVSYRDL